MSHGFDFFDMNDIPVPSEDSLKTADVRLPWESEPDTTSEFAKCHSPEFAEALNQAFMQHSMEPIKRCREPLRLEKRVTIAKNYYLKSMRAWVANGEDIESFILGSHESIREELRSLAQQENLL